MEFIAAETSVGTSRWLVPVMIVVYACYIYGCRAYEFGLCWLREDVVLGSLTAFFAAFAWLIHIE